MLTILADENIPLVDTLFNQLGTVTTMPGRNIQSRHLAGVDILLVRSVTGVDRDLLQNSAVKFVGSCTIGKDHLDVSYLDRRGIGWANAPGCNANAVVQYVFSAMARLIPHWPEHVVGIIGCGNVGGRLLHCLRGMGVKCVCYDPLIKQDKPELTTLTEVLKADIISCHTPLTTKTTSTFPTHHLLGEHALNQLKPDALLINTSRGAVIDNAVLLRLLQQCQTLKAVLDVWEGEPDINPELLAQVDIGTPHIAGYSVEGRQQGSVQIYQALCEYLNIGADDFSACLDNSKRILKPNREHNAHAQRNAALLAAYKIDDDDRQLRRWYGQQQKSMPLFFDQLRKNYPMRRDYSHCVLPNWLAKEPCKNFLEVLGFSNFHSG